MGNLPVGTLWEWWNKLARIEVKLKRQWEPLVKEHNEVHNERLALERLILVQEGEPEGSRKMGEAWRQIEEGGEGAPIERRPPDVAYDVLIQEAKPIHYRELLKRIEEQGVSIGGRDPGSTLIAYLGRDKRFAKAKQSGRGYYQLKEWENKKG